MNLLAPLANLFRTPAERDRAAILVELEKRLKGAERKVREAYDYADTVVSDWEREREMNRRQPGYRGDRKDGDNWPFLTNMEDLRRYRGLSREACEGNGYGAGILDRAVDFVIGDGMQVEVTLKGPRKGAVATGVADADGDGRPDADSRVDEVVQIIDEFKDLNDWGCGEEDREEEGFRRSQRDAEVCARFFRGGSDTNGIPRARWVEPEQIDAPPSALRNERWGIRTDPDDVEAKQAFYVYDLEGTGGEWIDAAEIVWHKLGTDRTVLRGMPQFWLVAEALRQCDRLNSACAEVSAIQAQIAYVREHAPGVLSGQITDFVGSSGDVTGRKATPYGDKYRRVGYGENGTVVDMSAGMKFTAGPVSQGVPAFVSALQSRLRQVCARFGYPEFFTGDASNGNYASLLAAGGPAERAFKRRQHKYAAFQAAVFRRACEYAVQAGRLSRSTLAAVDIKVKPGKVSVSNNLEDAQIDQILIQNKVKSVQTVMAERGLDPRVETANLQAFDDKFGGGAMGMGGGFDDGGDGGDPFGGGDGSQLLEPTAESYTDGEYEVLSEAQKNLLVKKMVTDKNGNTVMRWVSAGGTMSDKADPGTRRAELIKTGDKRKAVSRKSDTPKADTPKAEPKVPAKTRDQLDYLPKDPKRLTVDQAEKGLSDLGYADVKWDGDVTTATDPSGAKQSLRPVDVKRILYGDAAVPKASRMSVEDLSRAYTQAGGGKILGPAKGEPLTKPKAYRVKTGGGAESVVTAGEILKAVVAAGLARESYREDQYDVLSEADRSGLVRKNLGTDKRGRKIVRWVRPDADGGGLSRGKVGDIRSALDAAVKDPASLTPQSLALVEAHVGDLTAAEKRQYAKALKAANRPPEPPKTATDVKPPRVSADEAKAFFDYSEDVGYDLNATLRDGDTPSGRERQVYDAVSRVISERGKIDPPVKVYRALSWSHPEDRAEFLKGVSAGGEVTLGGLQSTSLDRGFVESAFGERRGGAVVMEIVANRGVRMAGDMTAHEAQKEVLLPHGGKYRVVGVEEAGGKTVLKLVQL